MYLNQQQACLDSFNQALSEPLPPGIHPQLQQQQQQQQQLQQQQQQPTSGLLASTSNAVYFNATRQCGHSI